MSRKNDGRVEQFHLNILANELSFLTMQVNIVTTCTSVAGWDGSSKLEEYTWSTTEEYGFETGGTIAWVGASLSFELEVHPFLAIYSQDATYPPTYTPQLPDSLHE